MHSVIRGMMGPLKYQVTDEVQRWSIYSDSTLLPDTVITLGQLPIAVPEEDALLVLLPALLEVSEGGTTRGGVAELLALVGTLTIVINIININIIIINIIIIKIIIKLSSVFVSVITLT